jgi:hypothetical protein
VQLLGGLFSTAFAHQGLSQIVPGIPCLIIEADGLPESWDGAIECVVLGE